MDNRNEATAGRPSSLAEKALFKLLSKIQYGMITLRAKGTQHHFQGQTKQGNASATIHVNHPRTYSKILFKGSIGAAESYMDGDWETDNLTQLIEIVIQNQEIFYQIETPLAKTFNYLLRFINLFQKNKPAQAKSNILAHYDLGNDFFELFLDSHRMYSSALYTNQDLTLEQASLNKLQEICQRLELKSSDHVMEIGSGWGGFAIYAAQQYGCKVTTTTISDKQYHHVQTQIKHLGLEEKITLLNQDYRHLEGKYDKLVSIEMIEAVGHNFFDTFFDKCNALLKPGGLFFLQAITINDQAYERAKYEVDFIKKYIFPGGCLPSMQSIFDCIARKTQMQLLHARDLGRDYALTISAWLQRFNQQKQSILQLGYSEKFIRMWEFYFCYCMAAFKQEYISDVHLLWKKRGC